MISFIIPTIYKSKRLLSLLQSLNDHSLVSEILLVEDCPSTGILDDYYFDKLIVVPFKERKFCNGGWNLGVSLSTNHYYALCSDDILFPTSIIDDVLHFYKLRPESGVIGMDPSQYEIEFKPLVYGFIQRKTWEVNQGWGALQFNHKNNPLMIPEDLKHWCGDTYNLYYSKYPCYNYFGEKFFTTNNDHGTSTNEEVMSIIKNDCDTFEEKYKLEKPIWA